MGSSNPTVEDVIRGALSRKRVCPGMGLTQVFDDAEREAGVPLSEVGFGPRADMIDDLLAAACGTEPGRWDQLEEWDAHASHATVLEALEKALEAARVLVAASERRARTPRPEVRS